MGVRSFIKVSVLLVALVTGAVSGVAAIASTTAPAATAAATAPADAASIQPAGPTVVTVGVFVNTLPTMSLKENRFQVDFYIWFRWKGKLDKSPSETFELANGKLDSRQLITLENKNGENYACLRCLATITKFWDVRRFPFDNHDLELIIEDNLHEAEQLTYVADTTNSTVSPDFKVPGWRVAGGDGNVATYQYKTNYGDVSLPHDAVSEYSRFNYRVHLRRDGLAAVPKLFFGLWVALALALLTFYMLPSEAGPRLGFAASSVFASVGAMYAISSNLPMTTDFTIAERVNMLTIACVFVSLAATVYSCQRFKKTNDLEASRRFDLRARWLILMIYVIGNAMVVSF